MTIYNFKSYQWPEKDEVTIVVPIHGQLEVTKNFLNSFQKQTFKCPIVFVDDESPDNSVEWLSDNGYDVIVPDRRLWFNGILNEAIARAKTPCLGFLNNDLIIGSRFVEKLLEAFRETDCGILIPFTVEPFKSQDQLESELPFKVAKVYRQEGWCMLFRTDAVRSLPPIPTEDLKLWYGDTWIFHHAWAQGVKVGVMMHNRIAHVGSVTIKSDSEFKKKEVHPVIEQDTQVFEEKYIWVKKKKGGLHRLLPRKLRKKILDYY